LAKGPYYGDPDARFSNFHHMWFKKTPHVILSYHGPNLNPLL